MQFQAVIFDLDGLLIDTERVSQQAGIAACRELGYELSPEFFIDQLLGVDFATGAARLIAHLGPDLDMDALHQGWINQSKRLAADGLKLLPGAQELLDHVDKLGLPKAVATSSQSARARQKLQKAGINHRFDTLVGADDVGAHKPAPDPYLRAAELLVVQPSTCLAFEDSDTGVLSALAAGMTVVQVPDLKPSAEMRAHHTADNLLAGAKAAGLL